MSVDDDDDDVNTLVWPPPPGNLQWPKWLGIAGFLVGPIPGLIGLIWALNIRWDYRRYNWDANEPTKIVRLCLISALVGLALGISVWVWLHLSNS